MADIQINTFLPVGLHNPAGGKKKGVTPKVKPSLHMCVSVRARVRACACTCVAFTCVGPHVRAQVAGLAETLPALVAKILSLAHERPQHP